MKQTTLFGFAKPRTVPGLCLCSSSDNKCGAAAAVATISGLHTGLLSTDTTAATALSIQSEGERERKELLEEEDEEDDCITLDTLLGLSAGSRTSQISSPVRPCCEGEDSPRRSGTVPLLVTRCSTDERSDVVQLDDINMPLSSRGRRPFALASGSQGGETFLTHQQQQQRQQVQTFLDFGQASLSVGSTCPGCRMLLSGLEEDDAIHRRVCAALRAHKARAWATTSSSGTPRGERREDLAQQPSGAGHRKPFEQPRVVNVRGGNRKRRRIALEDRNSSVGRNEEEIAPLLHSHAAIKLLEEIYQCSRHALSSTTTARVQCTKVSSSPLSSSVSLLSSRVASPSYAGTYGGPSAVATYILQCSGNLAGATTYSPSPALRLIDALGFYDAALGVAEYCVAVTVSTDLSLVLCAAAARSFTREQDPELVLVQLPDGTQTCRTQRRFTLCDINYAYVAPESVLLHLARHHNWGVTGNASTAYVLGELLGETYQAPSRAGFFSSVKQRAQGEEEELKRKCRQCMQAALRSCMTGVSAHVVYGQVLVPPLAHISFASALLRAPAPSRTCAAVPTTSCCLTAEMLLEACGGADQDQVDGALVANDVVSLYTHKEDLCHHISSDDSNDDVHGSRGSLDSDNFTLVVKEYDDMREEMGEGGKGGGGKASRVLAGMERDYSVVAIQ